MSPDSDLPSPGPVPEVTVDPPEPAHPDDLDTITPGLTDESGLLDRDRSLPQPGGREPSRASDVAATDVATEEPTA